MVSFLIMFQRYLNDNFIKEVKEVNTKNPPKRILNSCFMKKDTVLFVETFKLPQNNYFLFVGRNTHFHRMKKLLYERKERKNIFCLEKIDFIVFNR